MKENITSGTICLRDDLGIEYRVCRIDQIIRDDGHYSYVFRPDYTVIDMLSPPLYQGIPGLDLDLRKEEYVREDMIPVFISERTPGENRADLWELLQSVGMDHLNRLEWLIRTDLQYFGDNFYVIRYEEKKTVDLRESNLTFRVMALRVMKAICAGNDVLLPHVTIDSSNRTMSYFLLKDILMKNDSRIKEQRSSGELPSLGRKRKDINTDDLNYVRKHMDMGLMTSQQAADKLGIGRATLFRRLKELG